MRLASWQLALWVLASTFSAPVLAQSALLFANGFETDAASQIAIAREQSDGPIAPPIPIPSALITYLKPALGTDVAGFFIQGSTTGPALFVAVDPASVVPAAQRGDRVSFTADAIATVGGLRQLTAISGYVREASGVALAPLVNDVSAATDLVTALDTYESELVRISGIFDSAFASAGAAHVSAMLSTVGVIANPSLRLRVPATLADGIELAQGCALTAAAIPMWRLNPQAQPSSYDATDFTLLDCPAPRVISAQASSPTSVRVHFDRRIAPASVNTNGSQFALSGGLTASAAAVAAREVTLTTSQQMPATAYTVTVAASVTDLAGKGVDAGANTAAFGDVLITYVAKPPVGDDTTGDGSRARPWATVSKGVAVGAGVITGAITARVHIQSGIYAEDLVMVDGVSVFGGYAADWTRDPATNPTTLRANNARGLLYTAGGGYTRPSELDGLILELDPSGIASPAIAALTIEEGSPTVRDSIVRLAVGSTVSQGIAVIVPAGTSADVLLERVTIEGGGVTDPNGTVIGVAIGGAGAEKTVTGNGIAVNLPMTAKRNTYGVDVDGGVLILDLSSVTIAAAGVPAIIAVDEVCGIRARNGASLTGTGLTVAAGGGFRDTRGICASAGSAVALTGATVAGGDPNAPAAVTSTSAALLLDTGASATIATSTLTGGQVTLGTIAGDHRSYGIRAAVRADLLLVGSVVDAGPGDWGIGIHLLDPAMAVIRNTQVNTSNNLSACSSARRCVGVWVEGRDGPVGPFQSPQTAPFSCCDPLLHGVVVEGGRIAGGSGSESTALLVTASGTQRPGACANGTILDAGNCPPGSLSAVCRGVDVTVAADFLLHNSTVYGGIGMVTTGARVFAGTTTPQLANNYIHGGSPTPGEPGSTSTGLFFVNGNVGTGTRIINNIVDGGNGATRFGAFEENQNSDPGRFQNNDVVMAGMGGATKSVLYRNCTPVSCAQEFNTVTQINTQLTGAGQTTFGQGGTLSNPSCMVDANPRGGDPHQAAGSLCIDAGLERNQACNICQTPWTDAFGVDRLGQGWTPTPLPCTQNGPLMTGDALPDIGPGED